MKKTLNKLESVMLERKVTYEKISEHLKQKGGSKFWIKKAIKELIVEIEKENLNIVILPLLSEIETKKNRVIRRKLAYLNAKFNQFGISVFTEKKEYCKEKLLMIEISKTRLNTKNLYASQLVLEIENLSNYECKRMFEGFLVFNFAISEARDFWRNKLK